MAEITILLFTYTHFILIKQSCYDGLNVKYRNLKIAELSQCRDLKQILRNVICRGVQ